MDQELNVISDVDVVLASAAAWRGAILDQLHISHKRVPHRYAEPKYQSGSVREFVKETSRLKALSIRDDYPNSIIVSADQLVALESEVFHKPGNLQMAVNQLEKLAGKTHRIICALTVIFKDRIIVTHDEARLKMRSLNKAEIESYLKKDEAWDCAGSYKIESLGASLFEEIQTTDPTTIIGIPATQLITSLRALGFTNLL